MELTSVVEEGELLSFEPLDGSTNGIEIVDHIERRRCAVSTPNPVRPREVSEEEFYFPVDRSVKIETSSLSLLHTVGVYVRNHAGWMIDELSIGESRTFPYDTYSIDFSAPIKLYTVVDSAFSIEVTADDVTLEFEEPVEIFLGARSHHKHPAATITTTENPTDVMQAVSYLGSALKATTPERSYPTLRGHPPTIEVGEQFHVPSVLERPKTGVRIEVPPELKYVYVVAPLAYYLGAEVVPGETPQIATDEGFIHRLEDTSRGFEDEVKRVLKQSFLLDCVTRTEGYYPVDLHERKAIEDSVDLDFADLYERSLSEQLESYLEVPYDLVEEYVPQWKLTAHIDPIPDNLEALPFIANDLAVVRSAEGEEVSQAEAADEGLQGFFRSSGPHPAAAGGSPEPVRAGDFTRSAGSSGIETGAIGPIRSSDPTEDTDSVETPQIYRVEESNALEQTWISDGIPLGASKGMIEAFKNKLRRSPTDGDIDITVICNSEEMGDEEDDLVDKVYGSREDLPFDVWVHRNLTREELEEKLQEETDFLHYIGHIDANGFECADGMFDAGNLEETGVDAFFLNACSSYQQGMHMIEAGAIAGVVTFAEVINSGAERVGKALARLLNQGFSFRSALNIAKGQSIMGGYYLVIGDGGFDIAQPEDGTPFLVEAEEIQSKSGESNRLLKASLETFTTSDRNIGSLFRPHIKGNNMYYISSGKIDEYKVTSEELLEFLNLGNSPLLYQSSLAWENTYEELLRS